MKQEHNWTVARASVIGNGHLAAKLPCQDSSAHEIISPDCGIAVVCDGAGSADFAHIGSAAATEASARYFSELVRAQGWHEDDNLPSDSLWQGSAIMALRRVRADLEALAEAKNISIGSLATTAIVVVYTKNGLLTAHVGDGRAGFFDGETWAAAIQPFQGSEANQTVFLTSDIWNETEVLQYVRTAVFRSNIEAFTLLTDGCEKSAFEVNIFDAETGKYADLNRPFPRFFNPNLAGLKKLREEQKSQEEINKLWADFLKTGTAQFKVETDDKTMILGVRC
jgi:hypothetical protein